MTPATIQPPRSTRRSVGLALGVVVALGVAACGGGSGSDGTSGALATKGPIKVWLSNNPEEIAWGKQMVAAWNTANPDQKVTAQEIPAGKTSEEVIGAAITAGNAPCLVFNTSPAAVPQFQKQGGLVALDTFPGGDGLRRGPHRDGWPSSTGRRTASTTRSRGSRTR